MTALGSLLDRLGWRAQPAPVVPTVAPAPHDGGLEREVAALREEVGRLAKAQARACVTTDAGTATAREALEELRAACRGRERDAEELRGAAGRVGDETRRAAALAWLPVLDAIEACLEHARLLAADAEGAGILRRLLPPAVSAEALRDGARGLELLRARALAVLARDGVAPVEAQGLAFDPAWHVAVDTVCGAPALDGRVARELLKGYRTGDLPLRLAEVVVYSTMIGVSK